MGAALQLLGRDEEALPWLDRTLELQPDYIAAFQNKMRALNQLHRFDEAVAVYHRLKALDPDNAWADWDMALLQMLTGISRPAGPGARPAGGSRLPIPKSLNPCGLAMRASKAKTILLGADEGMGTPFISRATCPEVAARGARVVLLVQDPLRSLLAGLSGVSQCVPISAANTLPAFDVHCPLASLPLAFGTRLDTIPAATAYLPPPAESRVKAWQDRLGPHDKLRVGLVWSGNP